MARLLRALPVALALTLLGSACGDEGSEPTPIDRAEPGDVTDAGVEGAFGEIDECDLLVDEAVASYQRVVDELGDAGRNDVDRIDAALESFGGLGPDLKVRAEGLDCDAEDFDAAVCTAAAELDAAGRAAEDFVGRIVAGCDAA